eukprot:1186833-Prorocentrum_minimum.AAC.2
MQFRMGSFSQESSQSSRCAASLNKINNHIGEEVKGEACALRISDDGLLTLAAWGDWDGFSGRYRKALCVGRERYPVVVACGREVEGTAACFQCDTTR